MRRVLLAAALFLTCACGREYAGPSFDPSPIAQTAVLVGAGDIGECGPGTGAESTARLLDRIDGLVFTAGDNAYPSGREQDFRTCYDPAWGRHKGRTRPSPGNHDYEVAGAADYFSYFGSNAGPFGQGYYGYTAGNWQIYSLNTNVPIDRASAQMLWLRAALGANTSRCTAVYFHHPPFSSGQHGDNPFVRDLWRELYAARVDVVIAGHDHMYERFAAMDADGRSDAARGVRLFIVGTGGARLRPAARVAPNSEMRLVDFGVLKLTLTASAYQWEFVQATGAIADRGADTCR